MDSFNIETESKKLKSIVGQYESDLFIADIASLLTLIDTPRMPVHPFQGLDSPLRQLTYLASLNLSCDPVDAKIKEVGSNDEWEEIVKQTIRAKAGYFDLLLPKEDDDKYEYYNYYKIVLPVFLDYFDTGSLNFEEQEIERIEKLFTPFNREIEEEFGLTVRDFLNIYELIDKQLFINLNLPFQLIRNDSECREFSKKQKDENISPADWKYDGENENIKLFIKHFQNRGERFKIVKETFYNDYSEEKVNSFFETFTIKREKTDYIYYTQDNIVLSKPIFQLTDKRYLIIEIKQLIHAIYKTLYKFISNEATLLAKFNEHKGKYLQQKVCDLFQSYFKGEAHIHNEYKTSIKGEGQDILVLYKGLGLIVEVKNKKAAIPHSYPKDVPKVFKTILQFFKKAIQEGYDQCYRVKRLFDEHIDFEIYDLKNQPKHKVNTSKFHNYFSIIVTEEKFRKPQIDLSHLLQLDKNDNRFPFSVSIDDLEIILLTMRKLKRGPGDFIKFLTFREKLQGRLDCSDELELWGAFINNKKFSIPEDDRIHFKTFPEMANFYDELYKKGLGFKNEKNIDKKKSNQWLFYEPSDIYKQKFN